MNLDTEFALMPAIMRLEQRDCGLLSIDLRGKGARKRSGSENENDQAIPNPLIEKFALGLRYFDRPQLKSLALHNHILDPVDFPFVFDALRFIPTLDSLVLFHHDLGDDGVQLLTQALTKSEKQNCSYKTTQKTTPLKELYLSHCGITCSGAEAIATALYFTHDCRCKLSCLQVLSLGSNQISDEGALRLARAFAEYPSLHRLVLHGNKDISADLQDETKKPIFYQAMVPTGWQSNSPKADKSTSVTTIAMAVLSPLILRYVERRWQNDRVMIRPYDELRRSLKNEMYKRDSTFVDNESHLKLMPDILAFMVRKGICRKQTSMHSHFDCDHLACQSRAKRHSRGHEICQACARISLEDVYELFHRIPHLLHLLRNI